MEELYFKLTSPDSDGLTDEEFEEYKRMTTQSGEINERKVLKVGTSQPQEPIQQEPMMEPQIGDGDMGVDEPQPMDDNSGSDFDTNFDAGVEADEDEDPKKYIQQLTGKLSQELGKYNNELGEPDIELSKYVGGMIVKQVAKNMDEPSKKELIKKINTTDGADDDIESEDTPSEEMMDGGDTSEEMPMESYKMSGREVREMLESFNSVFDRKDDETKSEKKVSKDSGKAKRTPFVPKKFN